MPVMPRSIHLILCIAVTCDALDLPEFTLARIRLSDNKKESFGIWRHNPVVWEDLKNMREGVSTASSRQAYPMCYIINGMKKNSWQLQYKVNYWADYTLQNTNTGESTNTKFMIQGPVGRILNWVAYNGVCNRVDDLKGKSMRVVTWHPEIGPFPRCYFDQDSPRDWNLRDPEDRIFKAYGRRLSETEVECPRCSKPKWIEKSILYFPYRTSGSSGSRYWKQELEACISCEFDNNVCGINQESCRGGYNQVANSQLCDSGTYYRTCGSVETTAGAIKNGNSGNNLNFDSFLYSHGSCQPCTGTENIVLYKARTGGRGNINEPSSCPASCAEGYYPFTRGTPTIDKETSSFALEELVKGAITCERCSPCENHQVEAGTCGKFDENGVVISRPCQNCDAGQEPDRNKECKSCQEPDRDEEECKKCQCRNCENGKYRQTESNNVCLTCPMYQYSNGDTTWSFCLSCFPYEELIQNERGLGQGCEECTKGKYSNQRNLKQTCELCPAGTIGTEELDLRTNARTGCIQCTIHDPEYCVSPTLMNTPLCVSDANRTTCIKCDPSFFPNRDLVCVKCDEDVYKFPNTSVAEYVADYKSPCEWRCLKDLYLDQETEECRSCHIPCQNGTTGYYRPFCAIGQRSLPVCQRCSNTPGNRTDRFLNIHFAYSGNLIQKFTGQPCEFYCMIGYNMQQDCAECTGKPDNSHYSSINDCKWTCDRSYRLSADPPSCVKCDEIDYPRRTIDRLLYAAQNLYYGNNLAKKANFSICHDNDLRVFGVIQNRAVNENMCGNGLIELAHDEQCDDGNTINGDGCSSTCTLENNFFFCDRVGTKCEINCGYSDDEMVYRYLTDDECTFSYQYSTNRTLDTKLCGSECEDQGRDQLLNMDDCTSFNRGCRQCKEGSQYQSKNTNDCRNCGSDCKIGFFSIGLCIEGSSDITALSTNVQQKTTFTLAEFDTSQYPDRLVLQQAAIGCLPCHIPTQADVSDPSVIRFTNHGSEGRPDSCPYDCKFDIGIDSEISNYYCTNKINGRCVGQCRPCSTNLSQTCPIGQYLSICTEIKPPTCSDCNANTENRVYEATVNTPRDALECKTKCDNSSMLDIKTQECRVCNPTDDISCDTDEYIAVCTREPSDDTDAPLEEFGFMCKKCPYIITDKSNPNDNKKPIKWSGSDRMCTMDCQEGEFHRNGYDPSSPYEPFPCYPCSIPSEVCQENQRYIPCTPQYDTSCEACPNISDTLNIEYYVPEGQYPNCHTRCKEGFFFNASSGVCVQCTQNLCPCEPDICFKTDNECVLGYQRDSQPGCVQCNEQSRPRNAVWVRSAQEKCVWTCINNTVYNPSIRECILQRSV